MKNSSVFLKSVLAVSLFAMALISGCKKNSDSSGTCSDGLQNQYETGVDCGGNCTACPTCSDGIKNQSETGIDCGGPCTTICPCPYGFEGTNCTTLIRDKFIASYTGNEICNVGSSSYTMGIEASSLDLGKVVITNLHNQGTNVTANVSSNTFDIPLQLIGTNIDAIGSGSLSGNNLSLSYTIRTNGTGNTCVFTGSK